MRAGSGTPGNSIPNELCILVSNPDGRRKSIMLLYQKPTVISLAAASTAIQGNHSKLINRVPDADQQDPTLTSGMAYDLDE
jgi:hypothetical protein